ncbi:MAG TPA: DUF3288 family protein [Allocoleopsis sp.]
MNDNQNIKHPQEKPDQEIINTLLNEDATNYNMAELARLRIRYQGFPGAKEVKKGLDKILQKWELTEEELFAETRKIHTKSPVYAKHNEDDKDDWN